MTFPILICLPLESLLPFHPWTYFPLPLCPPPLRFDDLGGRHVEVLRRLTKQIQDARIARDNESIKHAINEYDEALEAYIPGLMSMASIYWDMEHYSAVER